MGIAASLGCAVHCAAMPFVIAFLPMLGLSFLADKSFHRVMVVFCLLIAAAAFIPGWQRHHKLLPILVATAGLGLIGIEAFAIQDECCADCAIENESALVLLDTTDYPELETSGFDKTLYLDVNCEIFTQRLTREIRIDSPGDGSSPARNRFVSWIAPLGGILLMIAHLVNRVFSNHCGCHPEKKISKACR